MPISAKMCTSFLGDIATILHVLWRNNPPFHSKHSIDVCGERAKLNVVASKM